MSTTIVETKYYGPTNTMGARIKVCTVWGNKFVAYNHAADYGVGIDERTIAQTVVEIHKAGSSNKYLNSEIDVFDVVSATGPSDDRRYWIATFDVAFAG